MENVSSHKLVEIGHINLEKNPLCHSSRKPNDHTSGSVSLSSLLETFSNNGGIVDGNPPMNEVDHPLMIDCPKMPNNHTKGKDKNLSSCTQK